MREYRGVFVFFILVILAVIAVLLFIFGREIERAPLVIVSSSYEQTSVLTLVSGGVVADARMYCESDGGVFNECGPSFCEITSTGNRECVFDGGCSLTCTYPPPPITLSIVRPIREAVLGTRFALSWELATKTPPVAVIRLVSSDATYSWPVGVVRKEVIELGEFMWNTGQSIGGGEREKIEEGEYYFVIDAYDGEVCVLSDCDATSSAFLFSATSSSFLIKKIE